jgi:hypothetical protein
MSAQIKVKRLNSQDGGFKETLLSSLSLPMADDEAIDATVAKILLAVKEKGDEAVLAFTKQFDRLNINQVSELEIPQKDLEQAYKSLAADQKSALDIAAQRVRTYHEQQKIEAGCHSWEYEEADGTRLSLFRFDECYTSQSRWCSGSHHGCTNARWCTQPIGIGRCLFGGCGSRLYDWRRTSSWRFSLWHKNCSGSRQDRWSR